jgi:(R)-2-hydroxyacyl-CoA dehydratese activating ATPase
MICAGIDAGSRAIKVVLVDSETGEVLASGSTEQGVRQAELASTLFERVLGESGIDPRAVERTVATGYGRNMIHGADSTITEITCHAAGVLHLVPEARTVIEIGGQDSKLLRLDPKGKVRDFKMNDRCAAGTGRFLEVVATRLGVELDRFGEMARSCTEATSISSMCVVFAETEIVGLLGTGVAPEQIAAGVQVSIASRIAAMVGRRSEEPIVFTGGVALVPGMDAALQKALGKAVTVVPEPMSSGALGAALLAARAAFGRHHPAGTTEDAEEH